MLATDEFCVKLHPFLTSHALLFNLSEKSKDECANLTRYDAQNSLTRYDAKLQGVTSNIVD